jgi:hypothetical protein
VAGSSHQKASGDTAWTAPSANPHITGVRIDRRTGGESAYGRVIVGPARQPRDGPVRGRGTGSIDEHRAKFGVEPICDVLPIAPSVYYEQRVRQRYPERRPRRVRQDETVTAEIYRVWRENQEVYGVRKVWKQLRREGQAVARCTVARLMHRAGLRGGKRGRKFKAFTDREEIALWRAQGLGVREIARRLARAPSTISREVRRNAATRSGGLARVDVLVVSGTSAVLAAKRVTTTLPIVIAGASDPVGFGIVASLAHPGGNVTGVSDSPGRTIEGKRLELLKEAVPEATRVGVVLDSSGRRDPGSISEAAKALGLTVLVSLETTNANEFRRSVAALKRDGAQVLYAPETPVNAHHRDLLVSLALEHRLPAMC